MGSPAAQNPAQPPVGNAPTAGGISPAPRANGNMQGYGGGQSVPNYVPQAAPQLNPQQQQQMMQMMQQRGNMTPRAGMPQGMPQGQMGQGQMGQPNQQQMLNFASMMQQRFGGAGQNRPAPVTTLK